MEEIAEQRPNAAFSVDPAERERLAAEGNLSLIHISAGMDGSHSMMLLIIKKHRDAIAVSYTHLPCSYSDDCRASRNHKHA